MTKTQKHIGWSTRRLWSWSFNAMWPSMKQCGFQGKNYKWHSRTKKLATKKTRTSLSLHQGTRVWPWSTHLSERCFTSKNNPPWEANEPILLAFCGFATICSNKQEACYHPQSRNKKVLKGSKSPIKASWFFMHHSHWWTIHVGGSFHKIQRQQMERSYKWKILNIYENSTTQGQKNSREHMGFPCQK